MGAIGHVRIDFGRGGKELIHTWRPRCDEVLNCPDLKDELTELVNELREKRTAEESQRHVQLLRRA